MKYTRKVDLDGQNSQAHQLVGSTLPAPIDVEELDDDVVVISSPRAFEEAKKKSRRRTTVIVVDAAGMAVGRDLLGKNNHAIAVIGDGAMTAGQAYETMNNAGYLDSNLIIVLNDNRQVSLPTATLDGPAPPVDALSQSLTRLQTSRKFRQLREAAKDITKQLGDKIHEVAAKVDSALKGMVGGQGASMFEELGLYYVGWILLRHATLW